MPAHRMTSTLLSIHYNVSGILLVSAFYFCILEVKIRYAKLPKADDEPKMLTVQLMKH